MGYIIKAPTGGGGGDATAANQTTQITEAQTTNSLLSNSGDPASVFLDNGLSVFLDSGTGENVFNDFTNNNSVFKTNATSFQNESIFTAQCENLIASPFQVATFTSATFAATATLLQNFLNSTDCVIVNISFSQGLGTHDILIVYKF
jgi:hypothetical protein